MNAAARIKGCAVIIHGPRSCAYLMSSSHNETVIKDRKNHASGNHQALGNIYSTDMDDTVSIFGGAMHLKNCINDVVGRGYETLFIVTTCISGIIGDNAADIVEEYSKAYPDVDMFLLDVGGDIGGDYKDGFISCTEKIVEMIDPNVRPIDDHINLIGTSFYKFRHRTNSVLLDELAARFGLTVNCQFIDHCSKDDIVNFCKGSIDILLTDDDDCRRMEDAICKQLSVRATITLPAGLEETTTFITAIGKALKKENIAKMFVGDIRSHYEKEMMKYRKILTGKRAMIIGDPYYDLNWNINMLEDLEMEIIKIGITAPKANKKESGDLNLPHLIEKNYSISKLEEDIKMLHPDIVIGNLIQIADLDVRWIFLMRREIGIKATIDHARRMTNIMRLPKGEGWKEISHENKA